MFHLNIITPEKKLFEDEHVVSLIVPTVNGEMGILTDHHPIIALLTLGTIKIILSDETEKLIYIGNGYLEVNNNKATILADQAENMEDMAMKQIQKARQKAEDLVITAKDNVEMEMKTQMLQEQLAGIAEFRKHKK